MHTLPEPLLLHGGNCACGYLLQPELVEAGISFPGLRKNEMWGMCGACGKLNIGSPYQEIRAATMEDWKNFRQMDPAILEWYKQRHDKIVEKMYG